MGKGIVAVIDDEPDICTFLADLLADEGYEPVVWRRGAGAYDLVKRTMPSAVLLDMSMETPDAGLQVAEAICADPTTQHIPIIIVSAGSEFMRKNHQRLAELRCTIHGKPVDIPALLALLDDVIQRRSVAT